MRGSNLPICTANAGRFEPSRDSSHCAKRFFAIIVAAWTCSISFLALIGPTKANGSCAGSIAACWNQNPSLRFDRSNYVGSSGKFAQVTETSPPKKSKKHGWHAAPPRMPPPREPFAQGAPPPMPPPREFFDQAAPPRVPPANDSQGQEMLLAPPPREPIGSAGPPRMPPPQEPPDSAPTPTSPEPSPPAR